MDELYVTRPIKPRKRHFCRVCGEAIEVGEDCSTYSGVESGEGFYRLYFHPECSAHSKKWDWWDWDRHMPGDVSRKEVRDIELAEGLTDTHLLEQK